MNNPIELYDSHDSNINIINDAKCMEDKIYNLTNHGLDIIQRYYPMLTLDKESDINHEEYPLYSSPVLYKDNDIYKIRLDDSSKALKPIELVMQHENLTYWQAVNREADRLGLTAARQTVTPQISSTNTTDPDGIEHVESTAWDAYDDRFWGVDRKVLKKYGWAKCTEYTIIENGSKTTVRATDTYRMYVRNCGKFYKIYKPYDQVARFMIEGDIPPEFLHGLSEAQMKQMNIRPSEDTEDVVEKLDCVIICNGERDAMVAAEYGYCPIWKNSETEKLTANQKSELYKVAKNIYNIPNNDETGRKCAAELAIDNMDIYTAYLPGWISNYKHNGKPRKDLHDFFALTRNKTDFDNVLKAAKRAKYWDTYVTRNKHVHVSINDLFFYYFLELLGFAKVVDADNSEKYIYKDGNILRKITVIQIKDIVQNWLGTHGVDIHVRNATFRYLSSPSVLRNLQTIHINTDTSGEYSQYFQFANIQVLVTDKNILEVARSNVNYWERQVIKHKFWRLPAAFTADKDTITIHSKASHFFRYLINTSRIYWREEYENRATGDAAVDEAYRQEHRFDIAGPRLSTKQIEIQTKNLLNKIYAIGYMLYNYDKNEDSMSVLVMNYNYNKTKKTPSSCDSGKSFLFKGLQHVLNIITMFYKYRKSLINENADLILIDDMDEKINPDDHKHKIIESINKKFKEKNLHFSSLTRYPKIAFVYKFIPQNYDSNNNNFLLLFMSDYYHTDLPNNNYRETRQISDDFGHVIMAGNYPEEYYNEDFNFFLDCLQFYLQCRKKGIKNIDQSSANIRQEVNKHIFDDIFDQWAGLYFSSEDAYNRDICKNDIVENYKDQTGANIKSMTNFKKRLLLYCKSHNIIVNPPDKVESGQRYRRRVGVKMKEFFYFRKA